MRIRMVDPLAVLATVGTVAAVLSLAPPALPAAAPARSATAPPADFSEVAWQGFGDRANSEAWSMQWFKGQLYVGTNRNLECVKTAAAALRDPQHRHYPPTDPDLNCPATIPALLPTLGAQIWQLTPPPAGSITQTNWAQVYADPATIPVTIDGQQTTTARDFGFRALALYTDVTGTTALYSSGVSLKALLGPSATPPGLLHTTDGQHFTFVPSDPGTVMGDVNRGGHCCFRAQLSDQGTFYLAFTKLGGSGQVYTSTNPAAGDNAFVPFTPLTPAPMAVLTMAVFNKALYLGTASPAGYTVWKARHTCRTSPCLYKDFIKVLPAGAGLGVHGSTGVLSMQVFTDTTGTPYLYVGSDGAPTNAPAEIIRMHTDDTWDLVVGATRKVNGRTLYPLSQLPGGFGWPYNVHMWTMAVYHGWLYVGTFDDSTAGYKSTPARDALLPKMGFDLYATHDGATFTKVTDTGLYPNQTDLNAGDTAGDMFSAGARTLEPTPRGLFVGTNNLYYGLRLWQGSLSPARLAFAASALFAEYTLDKQGIALTWSAPATATAFTVYRAILSKETFPAFRVPASDPVADAAEGLLSSPAMTQTTVWVPGPDVPVTTTSHRYYVDHTLPAPGQHDTYYVVAQDAQGDRAEPSNAVDTAALGGRPPVRRRAQAAAQW